MCARRPGEASGNFDSQPYRRPSVSCFDARRPPSARTGGRTNSPLAETDALVLDLEPDDYFDKVVATAASICRTPVALVSYITDEHQLIKSRVGLDCTRTAREDAFCAHTIQQDDLFVVEDALADERFKNNPFVIGEPYIRFYTGMPVLGPHKHAVGSLCVIDHVPRVLNRIQRNNLRQLSLLLAARLRLKAERVAV